MRTTNRTPSPVRPRTPNNSPAAESTRTTLIIEGDTNIDDGLSSSPSSKRSSTNDDPLPQLVVTSPPEVTMQLPNGNPSTISSGDEDQQTSPKLERKNAMNSRQPLSRSDLSMYGCFEPNIRHTTCVNTNPEPASSTLFKKKQILSGKDPNGVWQDMTHSSSDGDQNGEAARLNRPK